MTSHSSMTARGLAVHALVTWCRAIAPLAAIYQLLLLILVSYYMSKRRVYGSWIRFLKDKIKWKLLPFRRSGRGWRLVEVWLGVESIFYMYCIVLKRLKFTRKKPPAMSNDSLKKLMTNVYGTLDVAATNPQQFLVKWFQNTPIQEIKRGNVEQFLRWGLFSLDRDTQLDPAQQRLLEFYIRKTEERCQYIPPEGFNPDIQPMRPSLDNFEYQHRPLTYYLATHLVAEYCVEPLFLRRLGFLNKTTGQLTYWYRSGRNSESPPLVFIHGIGFGLVPYMKLIQEFAQLSCSVFLIMIPSVSNRITTEIPDKNAVVLGLTNILVEHGYPQAVFSGHSYGTAYVSWMVQTFPDRVLSSIFIDPIVFLFNSADLALNFLYKKPNGYACHTSLLVDYFVRRDIFTLNTLFRHFWWFEASLWKEDMVQDTAIILSEYDSIVPSAMISAYMKEGSFGKKETCDASYRTENPITGKKIQVEILPSAGHGDFVLNPKLRQKVVKIHQEMLKSN